MHFSQSASRDITVLTATHFFLQFLQVFHFFAFISYHRYKLLSVSANAIIVAGESTVRFGVCLHISLYL